MPFTKEQKREWLRKRRADRRMYSLRVLGGKCVQCGLTENLQLHHKDKSLKEVETKDFGQVSWKRFVAELKKCELLCARCHTFHHNEEKGFAQKVIYEEITYDEWDQMIQPFRK